MSRLNLLLTAALTFSATTFAYDPRSTEDAFRRHVHARNIVAENQLSDSYDFIIVGGGLAGLVLASRLSEDSNTTVLVLEAGQTGDDVADQINIPGNTYYKSTQHSDYDWAYSTAAQSSAGGRHLYWPRGKVLGGSSATNGMYWTRPSKTEIDAWSTLNDGDADVSKYWSWDSYYEAMKKSETFEAPSDAIKTQANIQYDTSAYGHSGPVHVGYPGYTFDVVGKWTETLSSVGVPTTSNAVGGTNVGSFVANSNINPSNWTRSYSRSAYIDPLPPRSNLAILAGATVTRIVWDSSKSDNLTATGVEYKTSNGGQAKTVKVKKEVIVSGGAIGSPQILQLSGIGPKDVLKGANVDVKLELPGVGAHLQDHLSTGLSWKFDSDNSASIKASGDDTSKTAEFMSFINSATAYVDMSPLVGDSVSTLQSTASSYLDTAASNIGGSDSSEVVAGYKAIYDVITNKFWTGAVGQVEILLTMIVSGSIMVQAAIQHPLSSGRIYITSSNAFDAPVIDPHYLSHPSDVAVMREGLKLARRVGQSGPLKDLLGEEQSPGSKVSTDDEWDSYLTSAVGTEYHPSSSCAMLPKSKGGVVNGKLQVYGTANVRVADASVYPLSLSAHLGAPTFGLAEQAANIIRSHYNAQKESSSSSTSSSSSSSSEGSSSADNSNGASSPLQYSSRTVFIVTSLVSIAATLSLL